MLIEFLLGLFVIFVALCVAFYLHLTRNYGYWDKLGVPNVPPKFPFGSMNIAEGEHLDRKLEILHKQFKDEKFFGLYMFSKPFLNISDPELLKLIQVKDFDHFVDRTSPAQNRLLFSGGDLNKIWLRQLTSLTGDEWKEVRAAFSPIFTSGKMKNMMKFIQHVSGELVNEFDKHAKAGEEFEVKNVFNKFSMNALASAAFGLDAQSFSNEKSLFVKHAARAFANTGWDKLNLFLRIIPGVVPLIEFFGLNTQAPEATKFFRDVIMQSIKLRRQTGDRKNDLIDLMLDAMKDDDLEKDDDVEEEHEKEMKLTHKRKKQLDELDIVATALVILVAGYDTTAIALSYTAYELANHPDIQEKLQEEIDQAYQDARDGFPDYNVIMNLPYLDMVLFESLRYNPPVGANWRAVEKDWKLPNTNIVLKKGDILTYNARYLHRLPEHWSHPDQFYPEHFSKEEKSKRNM